jgi:hypothetical protein
VRLSKAAMSGRTRLVMSDDLWVSMVLANFSRMVSVRPAASASFSAQCSNIGMSALFIDIDILLYAMPDASRLICLHVSSTLS